MSRGASRSSRATCVVQRGPFGRAHHLQQPVGPLHPVAQQRAGALQMPEVGDPDAAAAVLVLVRRADAPPGGAELLALLAGGVEQLVIGQDQMGAVGDEDPALGVDAPLGELVQLAEEGLGIEHDAVAHDAGDPRVEDAGRDLPEDELGLADDDGVPGVGAALVAHDQVGPLGEHVDQLALAFVAPLRPNDHQTGGPAVEHRDPQRNEKEPLAGLLNPRANVSEALGKVNSGRDAGEGAADPLGGLQRERLRHVGRRVDHPQGVPGEPADGDRGRARPGQRKAVHQDAERQPARADRDPERRQPGRERRRQRGAPGIVAHHEQRPASSMVSRFTTSTPRDARSGVGEDPRPDHPELLGAGDQDPGRLVG